MTQNSSQSRAAEVWRRFAGMFGREAVARKYGDTVPDEWPAMLSRLNDFQVQRGIRQLAYSGKQHVPSLPEFVKLCRDAEHDHVPSEKLALPNPSWQGDDWDASANQHLLGYITRQIPLNSQRYGKGPSYEAMKDLTRTNDKILDASPEFVRNVHTLVAFKNRWAEIMREADTGDGVPKDEQEHCWRECMRMAEEQIGRELAA